MMIARTKWDIDKKGENSNAMVVMMNMKEYQAKNHTHLDIGHFGIYYKGHLALDAGIYQGKDENNGWGKLNYVNYYARTIAHNSLLILDPNEPTPYEGSNVKAISRDGGQFSFKNRAYDSTQEMLNAGKTAQILASEIGPGIAPDYSYLKGDMTASYNVSKNVADYPAKVDTVRRSFVFLNLKNDDVPGALIVLDKVTSTNESFKKTWLLHAQNEPNIRGDEVSFESTQNGRNGKLQNNVLLPEINNQQIDKIGGAGKEYWVDGKNWGTVTQEDAGQWRIELSPKQ
jgi:heparin/heparan-sulfate lyase